MLNEFPGCEYWVKKVRILTKKQAKSEWAKAEQAKSEEAKSEQLKFPQITASSTELFRWFEPYIVQCMVVKITYRHQEAKCVNASLKVFHLFNFSRVWFFCSLLGCSSCTKYQKNKFLILRLYSQKTNISDMVKFGYGCINGFIAQKWLIAAEGSNWENVDNCLG